MAEVSNIDTRNKLEFSCARPIFLRVFFDTQKEIGIFLLVLKEHIGNLVGRLYSVVVCNFLKKIE